MTIVVNVPIENPELNARDRETDREKKVHTLNMVNALHGVPLPLGPPL